MSGFFLFILICLFIPVIVFGRLIQRLIKRFTKADSADRCVCGYSLKELEVARCPECGRVTSFNSTPEELGLSPEQLARIQQKRRERAEPTGPD
jgi:hypothetical protein